MGFFVILVLSKLDHVVMLITSQLYFEIHIGIVMGLWNIPLKKPEVIFNSCVIKIRSCSDAYYITIVFRNTYRYSDGVMEYSSKKM